MNLRGGHIKFPGLKLSVSGNKKYLVRAQHYQGINTRYGQETGRHKSSLQAGSSNNPKFLQSPISTPFSR